MLNYTIDQEYRIKSFDESIKQVVPQLQIGDICYRALSQRDDPCPGCAAKKNKRSNWTYYNPIVDLPVSVTFTPGDLEKDGVMSQVSVEFLEAYNPKIPEGNTECDPLTGLYREVAFHRHAQEFLDQHPDGEWCVAAVDIENFKLFNNWFGEILGDYLLKTIAGFFHDLIVAQEPACIIGYFGGDNFFLLSPQNQEFLKEVRERLSQIVNSYAKTTAFFVDMGVCVVDRKRSMREICDRAQIAVTKAKGNYHNRMVWIDNTMMNQLTEKQFILSEILSGLKNDEFTYYLQPQCNFEDGRVAGMEALVRWKHPTRGLIPPNVFIPLLEESGLITDLDMYIWEKVISRIKMRLDGEAGLTVPVSVNVSVADLFNIDVPETFRNLLEIYEVPPKYIEVEITESAYAADFEVVVKVVSQLREMGITVLMDDFGSGYSSLNMLKDIQVDILKLDMRFLDMKDNQERGMEILRTIVRMANLMQLRVIAEGIETKEQIDLLKKMGCHYGQGYYFYRPMPISEAVQLVDSDGNVDERGVLFREISHLRIREIIEQDMVNDEMLNAFEEAYEHPGCDVQKTLSVKSTNGNDMQLLLRFFS